MLKRVHIAGYKSLYDVEVKLTPLALLFGPNAAGKSNFLDALQLLSGLAPAERCAKPLTRPIAASHWNLSPSANAVSVG